MSDEAELNWRIINKAGELIIQPLLGKGAIGTCSPLLKLTRKGLMAIENFLTNLLWLAVNFFCSLSNSKNIKLPQ